MRSFWGFLREAYWEWSSHRATYWAGLVAYRTVFSLAPVLIIAVAVAGLVVGHAAARSEILAAVTRSMGERMAASVESLMAGFQDKAKNAVAMGVGLAVLLWGASNVFISLRDALNSLWDIEKKPGAGWKGVVKDRLVSFAVVLSIGFFVLVSLLLSAAVVWVRGAMASRVPVPPWMLPLFDFALSFVLMMLVFTLIFKFLASVLMSWGDAAVGAAATTLLFVAGKTLLTYFLGSGAMTSPYGAAGSLVLLLVWVNYSAQIFFMGASIIKVRARRRNRPLQPGPNSTRVERPALLPGSGA